VDMRGRFPSQGSSKCAFAEVACLGSGVFLTQRLWYMVSKALAREDLGDVPVEMAPTPRGAEGEGCQDLYVHLWGPRYMPG
jgi:hypothetical protein